MEKDRSQHPPDLTCCQRYTTTTTRHYHRWQHCQVSLSTTHRRIGCEDEFRDGARERSARPISPTDCKLEARNPLFGASGFTDSVKGPSTTRLSPLLSISSQCPDTFPRFSPVLWSLAPRIYYQRKKKKKKKEKRTKRSREFTIFLLNRKPGWCVVVLWNRSRKTRSKKRDKVVKTRDKQSQFRYTRCSLVEQCITQRETDWSTKKSCSTRARLFWNRSSRGVLTVVTA